MNDRGAVVTARLLFVFMCGLATLARAAPVGHEHRSEVAPSITRVLATEQVGAPGSGWAAVVGAPGTGQAAAVGAHGSGQAATVSAHGSGQAATVSAHGSGWTAVAPHAVAAGTSGRRGYRMHVRNGSGHVGEAPAWVNGSSAIGRGCSFVPGRPGRANDDDDDDDDDDDRKGWGGLLGALMLLYSQRRRFGM